MEMLVLITNLLMMKLKINVDDLLFVELKNIHNKSMLLKLNILYDQNHNITEKILDYLLQELFEYQNLIKQNKIFQRSLQKLLLQNVE